MYILIKSCAHGLISLYRGEFRLIGTFFPSLLKGIVHFETNFWYVLAYLNGIQDVGVFVFTVFSILIFLTQTVLVCQSYNAGLGGPRQKAQRSQN